MSESYSINYNDKTIWFKKGTKIVHREDGPAIDFYCGNKYWVQDNKYHRIDGPAMEYSDGEKWWYYYGLCHRVDGPAAIFPSGEKEYWLNNTCYADIKTDEEWIIFQVLD